MSRMKQELEENKHSVIEMTIIKPRGEVMPVKFYTTCEMAMDIYYFLSNPNDYSLIKKEKPNNAEQNG